MSNAAMISESAMELIQRVGQTLFSDTLTTMGDRDWSVVVFKTKYDKEGGYTRQCRVITDSEPDEPISITITDEIDGPLLSLEEHRIDVNGKQWEGVIFTISREGEVKIELDYEAHDSSAD